MNTLNEYLLEKTIGTFLFQGHILWWNREWPWQRFLGLWGERDGATWGTLCNKSPGPDGIHPWLLKEIKWEIMSSVTRMYHRCLKTANIPEDCEVINMVSHMYGEGGVCACIRMHVYKLLACSGAFGSNGGRFYFLFFFKNQGRFFDEAKDRGYLGRRTILKRYKTKF